MPVTELAAFTTIAHNAVTPELLAACVQAVEVQDGWCAANLPSTPLGHEARGAALFQQVEDPAVILMTAHWASVAEHGLWIASEENERVYPAVKEHIDNDNIRFFHVDGIEAFTIVEDDEGAVPVLRSPVVGIALFSVVKDRKDEFDSVYAGVKNIKEEFAKPYVHRGGWRIEEVEGREDVEEYVVIGGWESVKAAKEFSKSKDFDKYSDAIASVTLSVEVEHYKRLF